MNAGTAVLVKNLCAVFGIPANSVGPNLALASQTLLHLYGMPLVRAHSTRRQYGNGILAAAGEVFPASSPFIRYLGGSVIMMQEFPYFFNNFHKSTAELVTTYKGIASSNRLLEITGAVGGLSALGAGFGELVKKKSVQAGVRKTLGRAVGHGPIAEAISERLTSRVPKPTIGAVMLISIVGANIAYYSGKEQMVLIKAMLLHRLQQGKLTRDQYYAVFGVSTDPSSIKKYWEYR